MGLGKRLFMAQDSAGSYAGYTDDLKLHYHAGDSNSVSGSNFLDISGVSGLNGSLQGNASFNSNGWVDFDGNGDYINIPHNSINTLNPLKAITISVWWYSTQSSTDTTAHWLLGKGGQSGDWEYDHWHYTSGTYRGVGANTYLNGGTSGSASNYSSSNTWIGVGAWYLRTVVYDSVNRNIYIYVGDTLRASDTAWNYSQTQSSTNSLHIGQRPDLAQHAIKGRISQVRIYSGAISQSTLTEIYNAGYQG